MTAATADWLTTDFYDVLGVPPTASAKEITRAYRKLARELHPDTRASGGNDDRFTQVTAAYEVLGDEARRREYDQVRTAARTRPGAARAGRGGVRVTVQQPGGPLFSDVDPRDLLGGIRIEDLFGTPRAARRSTRAPRRGADLEAVLRLPFEQAVRGATLELTLPDRTVSARIPPGVEEGQTVRLPAQGDAGSDGGPPGDLLVQVEVEPHPVLRREGRNLTLTVPVTFPEAALGADVAVPTLDAPVTVRIPPGTASGTTLRVRGRGVPSGGSEKAGDLLVTVQVDVPTHLTDAQRAALEQLAAATTCSPRTHLGA